jgi:hypothetical protein
VDRAIGQLLKAYGANGDCLALQSVNRNFSAMSAWAVNELSLSAISNWDMVVRRLEGCVREVMGNPSLKKERSALASPVSDTNFDGIYRTLVLVAGIGSTLAHHVRENLDRLTVTLVLSAASQNQCVPDAIGDGLRQCYLCLIGQSSNRWSFVARTAPIDCDAITKLIVPNSTGVVDEFLRACHALLSTEMKAPPDSGEVKKNATATERTDVGTTAEAHSPTNSKAAADEKAPNPEQSGKSERVAHEVVAPTIAAFVRASQIANLAAKAGVPYQWDGLILDDLAELTEKLAAKVDDPDDQLSAMGTLALTSLTFRTNAKSALLIPTEDAPYADEVDLRANISRSCMMWNQAAYTQAARPDVPLDSPEDLTVINEIPFSEVLARGLSRHRKASGPQIDLEGILSHPFGISGISLKVYNKFLADLGDNAHIAEPTRFANSNGLAFLEVTGSDMLTAQCSLHFEMAGPAALYYFSPSATFIQEQCTKVYQRLHLGNAVWLDDRPARTGPRKVPDSTVVKVGWNELCDDLIEKYESVCEWKDDIRGAAAFNELVPMCASAFTIGCAGRGSEPQRVNEAAVLPGGGNFVLDDKLTDGPRSARILPHTEVTAAAIKILRSARSIVCSRLGLSTGETSAATQSLFSTLKDSNQGEAQDQSIEYEWVAIEACHLTAIAELYFKSDLNFQRHLWITDLGECLADRWLIRSFTGHGSRLLNAFAASMNVAPSEAISELREVLESRMGPVLGDCGKLKALSDRIDAPGLPVMPMDLGSAMRPHARNEYVSADPLQPIDRQCLIDWKLVNHIRCALGQKKIGASIDVQILLSIQAQSGIQEIENALQFSTNLDAYGYVGKVNGVGWNRQHYVHALFLPLQKPTIGLLLLRGEKAPSDRKQLIKDAAQFLRSVEGFSGWPQGDLETLQRFSVACERWRRLALPPSICTMASPVMETACLSPLSLYRLSRGGNDAPGVIGQLAQRFASKRGPIEKNHGLSRITTALNKFTKTSEGLGGQLARAQGLKEELEDLGNNGTAIFTFARDLWILECDAIIANKPYRSKISTMARRWTALHPVLNAFDRDADFEDLEEDGLIAFVDSVNSFCLAAIEDDDKKYVTGEGKERSERARDSLQRLFHVLSRDGWEIPTGAWQAMGGATVRTARLSASSTLIFPSNIREISEAAKAIFKDEAPLATRLTVKAETMFSIPMRIGEASCPPMQCITKSGALTICKTPFAVDKSTRTSRVWPLAERVADMVNELSKFNTDVCPDGKWLYRFDPQATSDDVRINCALAALIRWATGDAEGRPHSLRAHSYMSIFWPGWQEILQKFLMGKLNAFTCRAWIHASTMASRWTQAIRSMAAAGHGAIDPGFEHYCSIWPLIYSMHLQATLCDDQPTDEWLALLDIKRNTMQQARKRYGPQPFDLWNWMVDSKPLAFCKDIYEPLRSVSAPLPARIGGEVTAQPSAEVDYISSIRYICFLGLGMSPGMAGHESGVFGEFQNELNLYIPSKEDVNEARKRKKSHSVGTALQSDIELARDPNSQQLFCWVAALAKPTFVALDAVMRRSKGDVPLGVGQVRLKDFWSDIVKDIPPELCLHARFGLGDHLKSSDEVALLGLNPGFQMGDRHRDLGAMPQLMLSSRVSANDVTSRRFTSILKLALLARKSIERLELSRALKKSTAS